MGCVCSSGTKRTTTTTTPPPCPRPMLFSIATLRALSTVCIFEWMRGKKRKRNRRNNVQLPTNSSTGAVGLCFSALLCCFPLFFLLSFFPLFLASLAPLHFESTSLSLYPHFTSLFCTILQFCFKYIPILSVKRILLLLLLLITTSLPAFKPLFDSSLFSLSMVPAFRRICLTEIFWHT